MYSNNKVEEEAAIMDSTMIKMAQVDKLCSALEHKDDLIKFIKKQMNVKKLKTTVKVPTLTDIIYHTRNGKVPTKKYFTTGRMVSKIRDVTNEGNPFSVENSHDFLNNISFKPPKIVKNREKHAYQYDYKNNDILDRLHIPMDLDIPLSKVDNNSEYFSLIKGRPIKEKFDKRKFAENQRKCFFKKLCTGFIEDEIKKQEEHHIRDLWRIYTIREELDKNIQSFENYLSEDHHESIKIIEESQQISHLKEEKAKEVKRSSYYLNAIKTSLYILEDQLVYTKYCKEAIYQISPTQWQEDFEKSKEDYKHYAQEMAEEVFERYQDYSTFTPDKDKALDQLVNNLITDIVNLGPPAIYFQHPWEVDMVFKEFELQNLHAAKHLADVGSIEKDLQSLLKHVKEYYKTEYACLQEKIKDLEAGILYQKERSLELEAIAKELTQTAFKDVVSADHILEIQALVHNMYNEIIGDEDTKLSYVEMMEKVETEIINVWNQAHEIPRFKYEEYERKIRNKMQEETTAALDAKRRERTIVLTVDRLHRSFLPPYRRMYKKLVPRSDPPPLIKRDKSLKKLSEQDTKKKKKKPSIAENSDMTDEEERKKRNSRSLLSKISFEEDKPKTQRDTVDNIEIETPQEMKVFQCYKNMTKLGRPPEEVKFEVKPKVALDKYTIQEIVQKIKALDGEGLLQRFHGKITEPHEALPLFKGYNFDFDRVNYLHASIFNKLKYYQKYGSDFGEHDFNNINEEYFTIPSESEYSQKMLPKLPSASDSISIRTSPGMSYQKMIVDSSQDLAGYSDPSMPVSDFKTMMRANIVANKSSAILPNKTNNA